MNAKCLMIGCGWLVGMMMSWTSLAGMVWPEDLWLDRGGFWTNRIEVVAENLTDAPLQGCGVAVPLPEDAGVEDVRVTDAKGVLLASTRREHDIIIPVSSSPHKRTRYAIYWGNPKAMAVINNSWEVSSNAATAVRIEVGKVQTRVPRTVGETNEWIAGEWHHRVPIRVANFSGVALTNQLFRFRLAEAVHELANPEWRLSYRGRGKPSERNGSDLTFRHSMKPNVISVFYLYVKSGEARTEVSVAESAGGELVPNDTRIDDEPKFPKGVKARFAHIGEWEFETSNKEEGIRNKCGICRVEDVAVAPADLAVLVFPDRQVVDKRGGFVVKLAKNEQETLQLAVRTSAAHPDFECEATAPRNALDETLDIEPGWVESVFLDAPSAFYVHDTKPWMLKYPHTRHPISDGWSGWWPDPIAPGGKTEIKAGFTKAYRLLVKTSAETREGEYHGELVWRSDGNVIRRDPYTVRVWNFALSAKRTFRATFDVRKLTSQEQRERVYKVLAKYGIEPDQSGRSLKFERNAAGAVVCDFTEFDRLTDEFFNKWGFADAYFPREPFSLFGWSRQPKPFLGEKPYEDGEKDRSKLRPAYKAAFQAAERLFWNHLKAKGWEKRFTHYISDEPYTHLPEIVAQQRAICDMIHEVDPAIPVYSSTWRWCEGWEDCLDIWGVSASGRYPVEKIRELQAKGKRFWFTTDAQFPLDSPYMASEALFPIIGYFLKAEKYECWNCINYPKTNAWKYGVDAFMPRFGIPGKKDRWVRVPCGDGVLMYPQRDGSIESYVPTVRIDAVRDGLETYSYLELLAAEGSPRAKALLAEYEKLVVIPNPGGRYSRMMLPNPGKIAELREAAGTLLDRRDSAWWNGKAIPVEEARVSAMPLNQRYPGYQRPIDQTELAEIVSFELDGAGELELAVPPEVKEFRIRPMGREHRAKLEGGKLRIAIDRPEQFVVEFPGSARRTVHIFADTPFVRPQGDKVRYFGSGEHHVGLILPKAGETICIDRGAVVYGHVLVDGAKDVKIVGRGILDASGVNRADPQDESYRYLKARGWDDFTAGHSCTAFMALNATNLTVSGIILRDAPRWALILRNHCKNVLVDSVKLVGMWRYNADGIDVCASSDVTIRDSLVRSFDDCLIARGPSMFGETEGVRNVLATNCVLWCDWGANLKVQAHDRPCEIANVRLTDCVFACLQGKGAWITSRPGSASTLIRDIELDGIEVDLPAPRWEAEYDNKRVPGTPFGRVPRKSATILKVNHYDYHTGDPLKLKLRYDGIRLSNFKVFGDAVPLQAEIDDALERTTKSWMPGPTVQGPDNFVITNLIYKVSGENVYW